MKTKIIPFELETAKKIQAGEIKGRILCKNGVRAKVVEFYMSGSSDIFVKRANAKSTIEWCYPYNKEGRFIDGKGYISTDYDLVLEVPDNEQQFKPFDKVLVRDGNMEPWSARLYDSKRCQWHFCQDGHGWNEAIPYEGNEHIVGTTDKPKEE